MSGTPSLVWTPPHAWNPIPCLESHSLSGTPSPCLEPHPQSGIPSLVWNPIPCLISHPLCPHLTPSAPTPPSCLHTTILLPLPYLCPVLAALVWPLTAPTHLIWPQAAPHLELLPPATLPLPPPTLSNIFTKGSLHLKRKFGFFRVFWCSFQSHLTWVQSHLT